MADTALDLIKKDTPVIELDTKSVKLLKRRIREDLGDIDDLAQSIKTQGQMQPIVVRYSKKYGAYVVIAGMRRFRACSKLKIKVKAIEVTPHSELHVLTLQLAENVKRKNFDKLEIAKGLKHMKALYEKQNPETRKGGAPWTGKDDGAPDSFVSMATGVLELSKRRIYEILEIADLPEEVQDEIKQAKTTSERNAAAVKATRSVKQKRKTDKLKEKAAAKATEVEVDDRPPVTLVKGDSYEILPTIDEGSVDLILTDPPYSLERSLVTHVAGDHKNETVDWDQLDSSWVKLAAPSLVSGGTLIAFCPLEAIGEYKAVCKAAGLTYRGAVIWHKTNPGVPHRPVYMSACEAYIWATKGGKYTFTPWETPGSADSHNFREGPVCAGNERLDHPTQKPLWLIEDLLLRHSVEGAKVLEPFAGVSTTLAACKEHGRECYGIERSAKFLKLSKLRLSAI